MNTIVSAKAAAKKVVKFTGVESLPVILIWIVLMGAFMAFALARKRTTQTTLF
jgi:hypothetical protein